jgi:hypothetical protein
VNPFDHCEECEGTGKEICDNPDHGFIDAMGGETQRLGCPCCGHDPDFIIPDSVCEDCDGKGTFGVVTI